MPSPIRPASPEVHIKNRPIILGLQRTLLGEAVAAALREASPDTKDALPAKAPTGLQQVEPGKFRSKDPWNKRRY